MVCFFGVDNLKRYWETIIYGNIMGNEFICSSCGSSELVRTDRHPAVIVSETERTDIEFHSVYKCEVCKSISSGCERTLPLWIYYCIEEIYNKLVPPTPCEYINTNKTLFEREAWKQ